MLQNRFRSPDADYNRVLVLGDGKILEFDSPGSLLQKDSVFKSLVEAASKGTDSRILKKEWASVFLHVYACVVCLVRVQLILRRLKE